MLSARNPPSQRRSVRNTVARFILGFIGVLGELMITVGLLLGGYVLWNVWWDSNQSAAVAQQGVDDFYENLDEAPASPANSTPKTHPHRPAPADGDTIGVLIVPAWYDLTNNTMPIKQGTSNAVLDNAAAGHYDGTAMPGNLGNFALAGHRRTHGNSFRFVDRLEPGDHIVVETETTWYVYSVTQDYVVTPDQVDVIAPVPNDPGARPEERILTFTTCHSPSLGEWGNSHRWITHATFAGWMPRSEGMPEQVLNDPGVQ